MVTAFFSPDNRRITCNNPRARKPPVDNFASTAPPPDPPKRSSLRSRHDDWEGCSSPLPNPPHHRQQPAATTGTQSDDQLKNPKTVSKGEARYEQRSLDRAVEALRRVRKRRNRRWATLPFPKIIQRHRGKIMATRTIKTPNGTELTLSSEELEPGELALAEILLELVG
jgi:hypothetical protein